MNAKAYLLKGHKMRAIINHLHYPTKRFFLIIALIIGYHSFAQDTISCGDEGIICPWSGTTGFRVMYDNPNDCWEPTTIPGTWFWIGQNQYSLSIGCIAFPGQSEGAKIYGIGFCRQISWEQFVWDFYSPDNVYLYYHETDSLWWAIDSAVVKNAISTRQFLLHCDSAYENGSFIPNTGNQAFHFYEVFFDNPHSIADTFVVGFGRLQLVTDTLGLATTPLSVVRLLPNSGSGLSFNNRYIVTAWDKVNQNIFVIREADDFRHNVPEFRGEFLLFPLTDSVRWTHRDDFQRPTVDHDTVMSVGVQMNGRRAIMHWSTQTKFLLHEISYGPIGTPFNEWNTIHTTNSFYIIDSLEEHVLYAARIRGMRHNVIGDSVWRGWTDTICFGYGDYTVNALSNDDSWGTVTGGGTYNIHSTATLRAAPAQGYHFVAWHDGDTLNPRSITVMSDTTLVALFAQDSSIGIAAPEGVAGPTLHPNPARGQVTVLSPLPMQQLEAVDLQGRTVLSMPASGTKATFSVAGWPAGIYTVRIVTDSSTCYRRLRVE